MSAEASDMSSWLLMGLPAVALMTGIPEAFWTALGLAVGTYLNWLFVAKRLRVYTSKVEAVTLPDFFSKRFGDDKHIIIHKLQCPVAEKVKVNHGNRVLGAAWNMSGTHTLFPATIHVRGLDKLGLLHKMTQVISQLHGINIRKLVVECDDGIFECTIQIFVHDTKEVDDIIAGLRDIQDVKEVSRV